MREKLEPWYLMKASLKRLSKEIDHVINHYKTVDRRLQWSMVLPLKISPKKIEFKGHRLCKRSNEMFLHLHIAFKQNKYYLISTHIFRLPKSTNWNTQISTMIYNGAFPTTLDTLFMELFIKPVQTIYSTMKMEVQDINV